MKHLSKYLNRSQLAASYVAALFTLAGCGGESFGLLPVGSQPAGDVSPEAAAAAAAVQAAEGAAAALLPDAAPARLPDGAPAPSSGSKAPDRSMGHASDGGTPIAVDDAAADAPDAPDALAVDAPAADVDAAPDAVAAVDAPPPPPPDSGPPPVLCCATGNPVYLVTPCAVGYQCYAPTASARCVYTGLPDGGQTQMCTPPSSPELGACSASASSGTCVDGDYCMSADNGTPGYVHACP